MTPLGDVLVPDPTNDSGAGLDDPAWQAVVQTLARKYSAVPLPLVVREVRAALLSDRLVPGGPAQAIIAVAENNIAALDEALARGATLARSRAAGNQATGGRRPAADTPA